MRLIRILAVIWLTLHIVLIMLVPEHNLPSRIIGEDAFYMYSIARNLARGNGSVYNFGFETNGYQPLVMIPYTLIYILAERLHTNPLTPLKAIWSFNTILFVGSAYLVACLIKAMQRRYDFEHHDLASLLAFLIFLVNYRLYNLYVYGLETGLYLLLLIALAFAFVKAHPITIQQTRHKIMIGILAGFTILARIDFAVIFACVLLYLLITNKDNLPIVIVIGVTASIVVTPWFLYNYSYFGSFIPSSGQAQSSFVANIDMLYYRTWNAIYAIIDWMLIVVPHSYIGSVNIAGYPGWLVSSPKIFIVISVFVLLFARIRKLLYFPLLGLFLGFSVLGIIYILLFWSIHFYPRYLSPIIVIWFPVLAIALTEWLQTQRKSISHIILGILICLMTANYIYNLFVTLTQPLNPRAFYIAAVWIDEHVEQTSAVGSFQSGTIGYFNENVYNLDGKVNREILPFIQTQSVMCYLVEHNIEMLVDWRSEIRRFLGDTIYEQVDPLLHPLHNDGHPDGWVYLSVDAGMRAALCRS